MPIVEFRIIVALLISLILLGLTIKNFRWGLYLFVFLCPIMPPAISLYINNAIPLITFQRVMLVILVSTWLIKYLRGHMPEVEKPPLIELLLAFIVLVLISSIFATYPKVALKEFFSERIIGIPIIYFLFFQSVRKEVEIKRIFYILIISGIIIGIIGIIQEIIKTSIFYELGHYLLPEDKLIELGHADIANRQNTRLGLYRVHSTIPSIGLPAYLAFIIPLAITGFLYLKRKILRGLMFLGIVGLIIAQFFTVSLGGWGASAISTGLLSKGRRIKIVGLLLIIGVAVAFSAKGLLLASGKMYRLWQLKGVYQTVKPHPFLGTGLKTANEAVKVPCPNGDLGVGDVHAHFQTLIVETGIPAFFIFGVFWLLVVLKIRKASQNLLIINNNFMSVISRSLFAAFVGNLILATASVSMLNIHNGFIIFWIGAAIAMRLWVLSKDIPQPRSNRVTSRGIEDSTQDS